MDEATSNDRIREFVQGASKLPVLPQVTIRLLKELDSPDGSARDIARIVEAEPAMAARLLKLANSSFYGHRGTIAKVANAVAILGSKTIRSLALTVWTHTLRSQARAPKEMAMLAPLLAHGIAVGIAARSLIERQRPALAEDAFMAGLLHDIGRVALISQIGADYMPQYIEPALETDTPLHVREHEVLGFDHRGLGAVMMQEWTLPAFLGEVAHGHHDDVVVPEQSPVLAAVTLADGLATRLRFNLAPALTRPEPALLIDYFGLADAAEMETFLELVKTRFQGMTDVLDRGGR